MAQPEQKPGAFWYREERGEAHSAVAAVVSRITAAQETKRQELLKYWRMYADTPITGFGAYAYAKGDADTLPSMSLNVTKTCADSIHSKITKNEIRPYPLPIGQNFELSERAKKLQTFLDGWRYEQKVHKTAAKSFKECEIFGAGAVKVFPGYGKVNCEQIFRDELRIDDGDAKYGRPREIFHVTTIDKYQLIDSLDEVLDEPASDKERDDRKRLEHAIEGAQLSKEQEVYRDSGASSNLIELIEGWRLPNPGTEKGGRHFWGVNTATIIDDDWTRPRFPIAFINWDEPVRGFFGEGLCKALYALQMELNQMMEFIQESRHLGGGLKVFVERGSEFPIERLTNQNCAVYTFTGSPPQIIATPFLSPETLPLLEFYEQKAYNLARISQLSANGQKPAGLDSGEAQRTYVDIESDGFADVAKRWEDFNVDIADLAIDAAKELAQTDSKFAVTYRGKRAISVVKWSEVNMERDEFALEVQPTAQLGATVAGKIATVTDLASLNIGIRPEQLREMIGVPNLEASNELDLASRNRILAMLTCIANGDPLEDAPDNYMNLADAQEVAQKFYNYAINTKVEPERVDQIRDVIEKIVALQKPPPPPPGADMNAPAAAPPQGQGAAPVPPMNGAPPPGGMLQ